MKVELCSQSSEIIEFLAKINQVKTTDLIEQIILQEIWVFLGDAERRTPDRTFTVFEDHEYPCTLNMTIEDFYNDYKEIKDDCFKRMGIEQSKQINLYEIQKPEEITPVTVTKLAV